MANRFVRASKFRHAFANPPKRDNCFDNVKLTRSAWDSNFIVANSKFVAVSWESGGGVFAVLDQKKTGKLEPDQPVISGHSAPVLDLAFSPFNDHIVASASEDCTVKVWAIPEEGVTQNITESEVTLRGHQKKVGGLAYHPQASNILASSSTDGTVRIWDVEKAEEVFKLEGHGDNIQSMAWSPCGKFLATTCKDKKLRIFNVREQSLVAEAPSHMGVKSSRCCWLGDTGKLVTVGFTRASEREMNFWDGQNWEKPLKSTVVDTSSGALMPFYDNDTKILFLGGKGDGNIRYYEITDDDTIFYPLSEFKSDKPQRGLCMLPKRSVDVSNNEVVRLYKVTPNSIEPLSFCVPRKSDQFQEDLFPECDGPNPALTAEQWIGGADGTLEKISLEHGFDPSQHKGAAMAVTGAAKASNAPVVKLSTKELENKVATLEKSNAEKDAKIKELEEKIASLEA